MEEKKIEKLLVKRVEALGGICLKIPPLFFAGIPDRLVLLPGRVFTFVELKASKGVLSPVQKKVHAKLQSLGFEVHIINSAEKVDALIKSIL